VRRARRLLGIVAVVALALALNVLVFQWAVFTTSVLVLLGAGIVCGAIWGLLTLIPSGGDDRKGRPSYGLSASVGSVFFLLICIVLYAFAERWDRSWDLTLEGRQQLSEQTIRVLESLNEDVEVTAFFTRTGDSLADIPMAKTRRFLEQCATYSPYLHVEFVDPQVHRERVEALDLRRGTRENRAIDRVVVLKCGVRQRVLPLSDVTERLEERDFANALINVVRDARPKVWFLAGHGGRDVTDAQNEEGSGRFAMHLLREAYAVDRLAIPLSNPHIPDECDVLVIDGLDSALYPGELAAIEQFLDGGGRLLLLVDPVWESLGNERLQPWLEQRYGIVVGVDCVLSEQTSYSRQQSDVWLTPEPGLLGFDLVPDAFEGCFDAKHPITRGLDQNMLLSAARSVTLAEALPDSVTGSVLLRSLPSTWAETDLQLLLKDQKCRVDPGERGPVDLAVAVVARTDGGGATVQTREARIVVVGSTSLSINSRIDIQANLNFLLNTMAWLTESEELIAVRARGYQDEPIVLSQWQDRVVKWVSSVGVLQIVLAAGAAVYVWRRRYQ